MTNPNKNVNSKHLKIVWLTYFVFIPNYNYMPVDKFFFCLGVLTFTTHHKQFGAVHYVLYPLHTNAQKFGGCFSTPNHPLVYGLELV